MCHQGFHVHSALSCPQGVWRLMNFAFELSKLLPWIKWTDLVEQMNQSTRRCWKPEKVRNKGKKKIAEVSQKFLYIYTYLHWFVGFFSEHVPAILPLLMLKKSLKRRSNFPIIFPCAVGGRGKECTGRGRMVRCSPFELGSYFRLFS